MSHPRIGIFARTFRGTTPLDVLSQARDAGFSAVQYNMSCSGLPSLPTAVAEQVCDALREAAATTGISIVALSATYNMVHPDDAVRRHGLTALRALAELARRVGIPTLTLCSGSRNAIDQWAPHPDNRSAESWRLLLSSMEGAIEVAECYDITLAIEPEPANVVYSAARARELMTALGSERVGVVFDAANLLDDATLQAGRAATRAPIRAAIDQVADRIVLVHAKDRASDGTVVAAGTGVIDFADCLTALADVRSQAPVITHGLRPESAADVAVHLSALMDIASLNSCGARIDRTATA